MSVLLKYITKKNTMIRKSECGVYFIGDWHECHKNILNHQKNRIPLVEEFQKEHGIEDINEAHDKWLEDIWLKTTKRGDKIYVVGDFIMGNQEQSLKILHKLKANGCRIHLIVGNHDKSTQKMYNMFDSIDLIKVVNFHKKSYPFIEEDLFQCVLCHYPMKSWFNKCRGAACVHGHTHDNSPWENDGFDLSFNVGFDSEIANMGLVPLEELYELYKKKLNGIHPYKYADYASSQDSKFIR